MEISRILGPRQSRLPAGLLQVNGLFAAVPQIERKLTGHPSGTPRKSKPIGAARLARL
jgi:hypothetical protein